MGADHLIAIGADCGCEQKGCIHRRGVELNRMADLYYDRLVRFFKRRSSREDAADLAQDTFARLWSTDLRQIQKPESFLFTTALNLLRDRARSAQARHAASSVPAEEELLVCPAPEAERVLDGERQMQVLEAALGELTPKCRAAFEQFHFEGRSQKDIADEQGISVSMVEKYVRQAVNHCQKRLTESSAEPTRTRKLVLGATAAVCAIICCIGGFIHVRAKSLVATRTGETRPLELEDGSRIVLDTQSRLRVSYTAGAFRGGERQSSTLHCAYTDGRNRCDRNQVRCSDPPDTHDSDPDRRQGECTDTAPRVIGCCHPRPGRAGAGHQRGTAARSAGRENRKRYGVAAGHAGSR
jgi:RNA polymerase sigma factor (sigma-70 family)